MSTKYRWLFSIFEEDGESHDLGPDGYGHDVDVEFVGTEDEAYREGDRRADLWEETHGGFLCRVVCERRGKA